MLLRYRGAWMIHRVEPLDVLLIEDNPGDASLIKGHLSQMPSGAANVKVAEDLASGIANLGERDWDVILLDLQLPDSMGLSTLDAIMDAGADVPVVVLTGNQDESLAYSALGHGAQDYLIKGEYDLPTLARSIRYAVERFALEAANRESDRRYQELLEELSVGVMVSTLEGKVMQANDAAARMYGYADHDEFVGTNVKDRLAEPDDRIRHLVACRKEGGRARYEMTVKLPEGDECVVRDTGRIGTDPKWGPVLRSLLEQVA